MTSRRLACAASVAVAFSLLGVQSARADFALVSQNVAINSAEQQAHFTLTFNQAPNFQTTDSDGRQADSFQVEFAGSYDGSQTPFYQQDDTAIVRGEEIHLANAIRVRSPLGDGGSGSGGWGPILTTVPFDVTADTVDFTVPTQNLGWTGGYYQYVVSSYTFGTQTATADVRVVPLPPAVGMGAIGLLMVGAISFAARRRKSER